MYPNRIPQSSAQRRIVLLVFSDLLSQCMTLGLPRQPMICFKVRITRSLGSEKSTAIPSASRLKSSITLNKRRLLPSYSLSCMKSMDQT